MRPDGRVDCDLAAEYQSTLLTLSDNPSPDDLVAALASLPRCLAPLCPTVACRSAQALLAAPLEEPTAYFALQGLLSLVLLSGSPADFPDDLRAKMWRRAAIAARPSQNPSAWTAVSALVIYSWAVAAATSSPRDRPEATFLGDVIAALDTAPAPRQPAIALALAVAIGTVGPAPCAGPAAAALLAAIAATATHGLPQWSAATIVIAAIVRDWAVIPQTAQEAATAASARILAIALRSDPAALEATTAAMPILRSWVRDHRGESNAMQIVEDTAELALKLGGPRRGLHGDEAACAARQRAAALMEEALKSGIELSDRARKALDDVQDRGEAADGRDDDQALQRCWRHLLEACHAERRMQWIRAMKEDKDVPKK